MVFLIAWLGKQHAAGVGDQAILFLLPWSRRVTSFFVPIKLFESASIYGIIFNLSNKSSMLEQYRHWEVILALETPSILLNGQATVIDRQ
jgi:hypothetical protein